MLLQTNSYVVPEEKRPEHARLMRRFAQIMARLGLECFEVVEQVGSGPGERSTGRFVQLMRFRDKSHQQQVQAAERADPEAQQVIARFCELVDFAEQQQQGLAVAHYYSAVVEGGMPAAPRRERRLPPKPAGAAAAPAVAVPPPPADPDVRDAEFEDAAVEEQPAPGEVVPPDDVPADEIRDDVETDDVLDDLDLEPAERKDRE